MSATTGISSQGQEREPPLAESSIVARNRLMRAIWEQELAELRAECAATENIYKDVAADELARAARKRNRKSLMELAVFSDNSWGETSSRDAIQRANASLSAQAQAALKKDNLPRRAKTHEWADNVRAFKQDLSGCIGEIVEDMQIDKNCNQVRTLIREVLDTGVMKKGEFCDAIGNTNTTLNSFLAKNGPTDGSRSEVYGNCWAWFKQRELAGLAIPETRKLHAAWLAEEVAAGRRSAADLAAATRNLDFAPANQQPSSATAPAAAAARPAIDVDISRVHLEGEETDSVPVYDSCDEIRKKMSAYLRSRPGLTVTQFCRDLHAQLRVPKCKSIQTKMLNDFRNGKGPRSRVGSNSSVYYAAYVLFEKIRVAQGRPKSKHRLEVEELLGDVGGACRLHNRR